MQDDEACDCEKVQKSEYSPCVVASEETIIYVLLDPDHWSAEGGLSNAAFSRSKLKSGDLSIIRQLYSSAELTRVHVIAPQLEKDPRRAEVGALIASSLSVREVRSSKTEERVFCVRDDGERDHSAHALLAFSGATRAEKFWEANQYAAARANLIKAFDGEGDPIPIDAVKWGT